MADQDQSPATKQDIRLLMDEIGKLYQANEKWKEELKQHFDVVAENLIHDFRGALNDKIQNHENRIVLLEQQVRLAAGEL